MNEYVRDVRLAVRALLRQPRFFATAAATVALGVGLNTGVFSVVNAALLRPLPYPEQEQVVEVHNVWQGSARAGLSPAEYLDYREVADSAFSGFGVYGFGALNLTGDGEPLRLPTTFASAGIFRALGIQPIHGRVFTEDDERAGEPVVLLGYGLWQRRFGGDPGIVGRTVTLSGTSRTILGILPEAFQIPDAIQSRESRDLVVPLGIDLASVTNRGSHFLRAVARLAPGVSVEQADAVLSATANRFVAEFPDDYPQDMGFGVAVRPVNEFITGDARPVLFLLLGASAFVLLVACLTVANLLLVRLDGRRRELAVRTALGAPRHRLMRDVLAESLVIALVGSAAGVGVAWWAGEAFVALNPPGLPRIGAIGIDATVVAFAAGTAVLTGLVVGLLPILAMSDLRVGAVLRSEGRGSVRGASEWQRRTLVVGQVALALVLLAGAGLLGRSLLALHSVDPGFRTDAVLTGRLTLPGAAYPEETAVVDFFRALEGRVTSLPDVAAAGAVTNLPLATSLGDLNFQIEGRPVASTEVSPAADWQVVTAGYFAAMQLRLREGRLFDARDGAEAPGAVVINRTMAERYWPGGDALGARFVLGGGAGPGWVSIVGIVDDVRHGSLAAMPTNQMYLPHAQFRFWNNGSVVRSLTVVARSASDNPEALAGAVRHALADLDPAVPLAEVQTMSAVLSTSLGRERLLFVLAATFAGLALVLGTLGIYGVVAYGVRQRTREIGVRIALGARASTVSAMVVRQGTSLALAGVGIGLAGTIVLARFLRPQLYGVTPFDAVTIGGVAMVLGGIAVLASWLPARRAARINPMDALRYE